MVFSDRGSVVSYDAPPVVRAATGAIGAGADDVFLTGGSEVSLASILPISRACKMGDSWEILAASFGLLPSQ